MTTNQARQFEMLQRVRLFAGQHGDVIASKTATQYVDIIARSVDDINAHRVTGLSARHAGSKVRAAARRDLERRLLAVSQAARIFGPEARALFRLPRPRSDHRIVTAAHVFLHNIDPLRDHLHNIGLPDDVIPQLEASLDAFLGALDVRRGNKQTHAVATAHIDHALSAGMDALRTLDIIVTNALHDNAALSAAWSQARKVDYSRRTRRRPRKPSPLTKFGDLPRPTDV